MADRPPPPTDEDVKRKPNLMERAKEEIKAALHTKKSSHHHKETHGMRDDIDEKTPFREVKAPNVFDRAKEEIEALVQTFHSKKESEMHTEKSSHHHKETHGMRNDIDEKTPVSEVKAPNVFGRAKEEIEALVHTFHSKKESEIPVPSDREMSHTEKSLHHHKETHGMRDDIDEHTPVNNVKAPNVFERAKEEIEALVQTIHPKKESEIHTPSSAQQENDVKAPNLIERAKEEIEAIMHIKKSSPHHHRHHHHKETHGMSDDIDENTPIDEVKGPNVFQRVKEEVEALVQTIHPKKKSSNLVSSSKEGGLQFSIQKGLEEVHSPGVSKKN